MHVIVEQPIVVSMVLFVVGLAAFLIRRNVLFLFLALEVMFVAAAFLFASLSSIMASSEAIIMFLIILTVAAAEVAIGLGLVLRYEERFKSLNADTAIKLRG